MTENLLAFDDFREALRRHLDVDVEMFRQAIQVPLVDDDPLVAAAVRRALRAVVSGHGVSVREVVASIHCPIMRRMDHAVSLVQAYLQLNGYFTSAEYPIIAAAGRDGFRTLTDIDVLAFRFPAGLPSPSPHSRKRTPRALDMSDVDPGLGVPPDSIDMVIGEVKEGRVGI